MSVKRLRVRRVLNFYVATLALMMAGAVFGQTGDDNSAPAGHPASLIDLVQAGGIVGYVIIGLSIGAVVLIVDAFRNVRDDVLLPSTLTVQLEQLSEQGRFKEMRAVTQANESMLGRIVGAAIAQGTLGLEAIRETMREMGVKEMTRLQQRIGYLNLIGMVAPMLGLLGTVLGMIKSFELLGTAKGAARPDELAVGISEALITTSMGLIVAIPAIFCHQYFRNRITRISQEASGICERLLLRMNVVIQARRISKGAADSKVANGGS